MTDSRPDHPEGYRREAADMAIASGRPATEADRGLRISGKAFGDRPSGRRHGLAGGAKAKAAPADTPGPSGHRRRIREPGPEDGSLKEAAAFLAKGRRQGGGAA
jgi:hypothetical protein